MGRSSLARGVNPWYRYGNTCPEPRIGRQSHCRPIRGSGRFSAAPFQGLTPLANNYRPIRGSYYRPIRGSYSSPVRSS